MKIHTVQLHLGDLLGGTQDMDNREYGAYVALFLSCYQAKDNCLPLDDKKLARIAKCTPQEWRIVKHNVLEKFQISGGYLSHSRVEIDVGTYKKKSEINRSNALKRCNSPQPIASQSLSETAAIHNPIPKTHNPSKNIIIPDAVSAAVWSDFLSHRKAKKAPVTNSAISGIKVQADKAQIPMEEVLTIIMSRGWTGFKAEWIKENTNANFRTSSQGTGDAGTEHTGTGYGGRKSQTQLASEITDQIKRDRRAKWESDQKLIGSAGSIIGPIESDLRDVKEIRGSSGHDGNA